MEVRDMIWMGVLAIVLSLVAFAAGYQKGMEKCMPAVRAFEEMMKVREIGCNARTKAIVRKYFRRR